MNFWKKIRRLPLAKRKIILWTAVAVIGAVLFSWWLGNLFQKLNDFKSFRPELPAVDLEEAFKDLPEFEMPPELLEELELMATSSSEEEIEGEEGE